MPLCQEDESNFLRDNKTAIPRVSKSSLESNNVIEKDNIRSKLEKQELPNPATRLCKRPNCSSYWPSAASASLQLQSRRYISAPCWSPSLVEMKLSSFWNGESSSAA